MKPLTAKEVADIMKKEVPKLLHERIAELEGAITDIIDAWQDNNGDYDSARRQVVSIRLAREVLNKK